MSENGPETVLRARAIDQSFGDVDVLSGVSLSVPRGTVAAVVGPNGSGKTTLLRVLAGIAAPTGGTVSLQRGGTGARRVGYLPQRPAFRAGFSARDTLEFYAQLLDGVDGRDVDATLERVGLGEVRDRSVGSLSGGMTRLLGLGAAVLGDPDVLILDEPGSGLDPSMVERLFRVVGDLAEDGTAVVIASHELPAVEAHADAVHVLDGGRFVASGSPGELRSGTDATSLSEAFLRLVRTDAGETTVRAGLDETTEKTSAGETTERANADGNRSDVDGSEVTTDE
ncbi:ABC transporter ATP-binding protein [Halobellus captivus]|uniref:ABC transporter ATP-binding protein n=1 Tax=Halobellus captivus TaxID=2592614 RepID=UPI001EF0EBAC|nr:ABC transporter ATP-binding protein [Halobellus captivus]